MGIPYRYQYDTNPRKIKPAFENRQKKINKIKKEHIDSRKESVVPNDGVEETVKNKKKKNKLEIQKDKIKQAKIVFSIFAVFAVIFGISYRNSLIDEAYSKTETLKNQYAELEKENEQIQVSIDNSINLVNIERAAKEKLGMVNLSGKQTVYISLPKEDYIETDNEKIEEENKSILDKILELF